MKGGEIVEFKYTAHQIKDIDSKKGIVTGYPSTFDAIDSGDERVKKGAFKKTIQEWGPEGKDRIKALFMHEPYYLLGKPLVIKEDDLGLYWEVQFSMKNSFAKDTFVLIEDKVITEQSIGYDTVKDNKNGKILDLLELKLYEGSFVCWGMNEITPITGVKSETEYNRLAKSMNRMEKALKRGTFHTNEIPEMMEIALKKWQKEAKVIGEEKQGALEIKTKPNKFKDFAQVELADRDWYLLDTLFESIWQTLYYESDNDVIAELQLSIDQFKEVFISWAQEAIESGVINTNEDESSGISLNAEDFPGFTKITKKYINDIKEGRVLSSENEEAIRQALDILTALLDGVEPGDKSTQLKGKKSQKNKKEPAGKGHSDIEEIANSIISDIKNLKSRVKKKDILDELRDFGKNLRSDD